MTINCNYNYFITIITTINCNYNYLTTKIRQRSDQEQEQEWVQGQRREKKGKKKHEIKSCFYDYPFWSVIFSP